MRGLQLSVRSKEKETHSTDEETSEGTNEEYLQRQEKQVVFLK